MAALQQLQELRDGDALGHCVQLADGQIFHRSVGIHHEQVLHVHEPDQVVFAPLAHRIARVLVAFGKLAVLLKRVLHIEAGQLGARRHDCLGVLVAQIEDVVDVLVLLRLDKPAFRGLVDEQLDLLARIHIVFVGRIVPGQPHDAVGDAIEHKHNRIGDAIEPQKRGRRHKRVAFRREDGERFGDKLAHDHVQRRHEEIPDCDRNYRDDGIRQAEQNEQRANERRNRGLAQPAERKRSKRNSKLAGRQVRVDVLGDGLRVLRAALALIVGKFDLRLAHAHHGEFRDNEKRVHQKEEDDKNQADSYGHRVCGPPQGAFCFQATFLTLKYGIFRIRERFCCHFVHQVDQMGR